MNEKLPISEAMVDLAYMWRRYKNNMQGGYGEPTFEKFLDWLVQEVGEK